MVGLSIKKLRKRKKITQNDLAEWLGVSRQAVAMWETGKRELKATTLKKIAQVFDATVDEIITQNKGLTSKEDVMIKKVKKSAKVKKIVKAKKDTQKRTSFELMAPKAKKVVLAGDFNSWDETGISLKKNKNGLWKTGVKLDKGRYEYKFIVDRQWWTDPNNNNQSPNVFGDLNSVMEVSA